MNAARDDIWPVAVVGAGAAGLCAAIFAGRAGARIALLEGRPRPGAKIRASGGGRCNVLPSEVSPADFHTAGSPHTLRNILGSWPLDQVRSFFTHDLGVPLKREATGKLFPVDDDPRRVVAALLEACARAGAALLGDHRVVAVRREEHPSGPLHVLALAGGGALRCRRLVLATGGLSLPKTGSDGAGYRFARALGHTLAATYPALVPLLSRDARWSALAGVTVTVELSARRGGRLLERREGGFLFTHRGFSGPVVLDLSRWVTAPAGGEVELRARWGGAAAPDWEATLRGAGGRGAAALLAEHLPRRLALLLLELAGVPPDARPAGLPRPARRALAGWLAACPLPVAGDEGYRIAEVTGGGVPLAEISPRTLESRRAPGLYLAGEMLDATGRIGGYNFLWAWVTGQLAGMAAGAAAQGPQRA